VIQLIGRKRWIVYEPSFESPLYMQQSKDVELDYPCPEQPCMDFILEPGDILYLPRGWWHNPLPLGEETLHLSIGTFPAYIVDYVQWAFGKLPDFSGARHSMSVWNQDQESLQSVAAHIAGILNDPKSYQCFMDEFSGQQRVESRLAIDLFGNPDVTQVPESVEIRLNANAIRELDDSYLIANGVRLNLDPMGQRLLRCIAETPGITLGALFVRLPEMDVEKLRVLVFELCRQDVLALVRH